MINFQVDAKDIRDIWYMGMGIMCPLGEACSLVYGAILFNILRFFKRNAFGTGSPEGIPSGDIRYSRAFHFTRHFIVATALVHID